MAPGSYRHIRQVAAPMHGRGTRFVMYSTTACSFLSPIVELILHGCQSQQLRGMLTRISFMLLTKQIILQ